MKVKLARSAGFCMGVRRAMEIVLSEANHSNGPIYTYGPIIHNNEVLGLLESKGVKVIEDIKNVNEGTIIIRAHGITPAKRAEIKASNLRLVDATCPRVAKVQSIIRYHTRKGYTPIIVGEENHPEVIGLVGYSDNRAYVIKDLSDVDNLPEIEKVMLVAQTTQDWSNYQEIKKKVLERFPDALVFDTICEATITRQQEVKELTKEVEGIVVVGGHSSGNTKRLIQVAGKSGLPVFHVDRADKLDKEQLAPFMVVGVTAGASTPNWLITEVVREIEAIKSIRETGFFRFIKNILNFIFLSNLGIALGAFSLSYGISPLLGTQYDLHYPLISFLYIYAMHVINRYLDRAACTYNEPERLKFYERHSFFLTFTSIGSIMGAYFISYRIGKEAFLLIAILTLLGVLYSIPLIPKGLIPWWKYHRIKDIPGSKTLSIALAWALVIGGVPALNSAIRADMSLIILSILFISSLIYVRSALFDIFHAQGDLIVGSETLPIILGEKKALRLLKLILLVLIIILLFMPIFSEKGRYAALMSFCPISLLFCIVVYEKRWLRPGIRFEAMIEGSVMLSGLIALIWNLSK